MEVTPAPAGMTRSARLSIFVNVVLICALASLLAFAVIWIVGRLAWNHDLRADLTRDARFTVDPLAASVLRGLREPVHATFVYGIDDEIRRRALDLSGQPREDILATYYRPVLLRAAARVQVILTELAKISELFTVDIIDADQDPQRMKEVAERHGKTAADLARGMNQVVFELGSRRRAVPMGRMFSIDWGYFPPDRRMISHPPETIGVARVQSELTETLRALAAGESLKIGFPKGIASAIPPESRELAALKEFLTGQGFEPVPFDLAKGVPPDVALVAIIGMGRRLLPDEAQQLKDHDERGGRLLLMADPRKPEAFPGVLEPYGVRIEPGRVEDPARAMPGQREPWILLSNELCVGLHEIDRALAGQIGIYVGMTRPLKIEELKREGAERVVLLQASNEAKIVPIEYREQTGEPDFLNAAKKSAPGVPLAAALDRPASGGKRSRIAVFGSWEVAEPAKVLQGTNFGNRDLVLNTLNWLAERHGAMGIVEREAQASRVEITPGFLSSFRWIMLAALPALLMFGGLIVWLKRRN